MLCLAAGRDSRGTDYLYSGGWAGELRQWMPAALELLYQNSGEPPGAESRGFTSAGGRRDSAVKQLVFQETYRYRGNGLMCGVQDGGLYSGDDSGQLCAWQTDLSLRWHQQTYSDIGGLAVAAAAQLAVLGNRLQAEVTAAASKIPHSAVQVLVADLKGPTGRAGEGGGGAVLGVRALLSGCSPLAVTADGSVVAVCQAGQPQTVLLYRAEGGRSWQLQATLAEHTDTVSCLAVSPAGTRLATGTRTFFYVKSLRRYFFLFFAILTSYPGGWDGRVCVWELQTGQLEAALQLSKYVAAICWAPGTAATQEIYAGGENGFLCKIALT